MYYVSSVLVFVLFLTNNVVYSQNEEDCEINEDESGKCTPLTECLEFISHEMPVLCPNDGNLMPYVCCPVPKPNVTIGQRIHVYKPSREEEQSKSYKKCLEWSELAYEWKRTNLVPGSPKEKVPNCAFQVKPLITGGEPAMLKEFPHMVIFGYVDDDGTSWECGGTLISDQFVLTAKHCLLSKRKRVPPSLAHIGLLNLKHRNESGSLQVFSINNKAGIIKYPKSNRTTYNDIALIKLDKPVEFSEYVRPACLHFNKQYNNAMSGIATGWGDLNYRDNKNSDELMKVKLSFVPHNICFDAFKQVINRNFMNGIDEPTQFCAGDFTSKKDTCQGDSGGPIQIYRTDIYCMYDIIGVTSFGVDCGKQPGVYTRVSNYRSWIESVVWPPEN